MAEQTLKNKTKNGLYWNLANQITCYGLQFIVGIIMARLLSPSDYGITALPAVFIAVAKVFVESGFNSALVRKPTLTDKDLSTAFIYSMAVGVFCYLVIFVSAPLIAKFFNQPILEKLVRITSLIFLWSPLSTPQNVIVQRKLDFRTTSIVSIATHVVGAIAGLLLAFLGYGLWSLVAMGLVSSICSTLLMWIAVRWLPKFRWDKESFKYLWGYGNKMIATNLIDTVYRNITPIFVGKFYSPADLGVYNRAYGYANLPANSLFSIVHSVSFPVLSQIQNDDEKLKSYYRTMIKTAAFITFPIMIMMSALAQPLIIGLVTEKWVACVPYLQIMCFWLMWLPIHSLNCQLLLVKGRSDLYLRIEIVKKVISLSIMAVTLPMGIKQFIVGSLINSLICLVINTHYTGKLIRIGFFVQMKDISISLLLSLVVGTAAYFIIQLFDNVYIQLAAGGIFGVALYVGISYLIKLPELQQAVYLIRKK